MPEVSDKAGWICLVLSPDLICHICILQYKVLRAAAGLGLGQRLDFVWLVKFVFQTWELLVPGWVVLTSETISVFVRNSVCPCDFESFCVF